MMQTQTHTIDHLLAETDWLRALARQLVRDRDRAEDLFQQTVFEALRDRGQIRGAMRPWLATVARNVATRFRRSETRRTHREAAAARPAATESVAETVEGFAVHRRLVDAVSRLEEPYHATLLLRYFEDLPPREIAVRMDAKVDTVKTRLKRALKQLRERLDENFGSRAAWLAPMATLGKPTAAVGGFGAALAWRATAAALVLVGAGVTWAKLAANDDGGAVIAPRIAGASEGVDKEAADDGDALRDPVFAASAGAREKVPESPGVSSVEVVVIDSRTDARVRDAEIRWFEQTEIATKSKAYRAELAAAGVDMRDLDFSGILRKFSTPHRTDEFGVVRVPIGSGAAFVALLSEELEGMAPLGDGAKRVELRLTETVRFPVLVVDSIGRPAEGIPVTWGMKLGPAQAERRLTDANGFARVMVPMAARAPRAEGFVKIDLPLAEDVVAPADLKTRYEEAIRLVLPPCGRLAVRVLESDGSTTDADGQVVMFRTKGMSRIEPHAAVARLESGVATFERVGLGVEWKLRLSIDQRFELEQTFAGPEFGGETKLIDLRRPKRQYNGPVATGVVIDERGEPVSGARVQAVPADRSRLRSSAEIVECTADGAGRFELPPSVLDEEFELTASTATSVHVAPGVTVEPGAQDVRLVAPRGAALELQFAPDTKFEFRDIEFKLRDQANPSGNQPWMVSGTDLAEKLRFSKIRPGVYDLEIVLEATNAVVFSLPGIHLEAGRVAAPPALESIDLSRMLEVVEVTVTDEASIALKNAQVWCLTRGEGIGHVADEAGRAKFAVLLGVSDIEVRLDGYSSQRLTRPAGGRHLVVLRKKS